MRKGTRERKEKGSGNNRSETDRHKFLLTSKMPASDEGPDKPACCEQDGDPADIERVFRKVASVKVSGEPPRGSEVRIAVGRKEVLPRTGAICEKRVLASRDEEPGLDVPKPPEGRDDESDDERLA